MTQKPLVILPAAGFGTRMGSPPAKEILPGPLGSPLIETALRQAQVRGWPVHVITRRAKTELISYLSEYQNSQGLEISIQLIESSQEWPDTVLQSQKFWRQRNLLCLPDTVFQPTGIWDDLVRSQASLSAALFEVADGRSWGVMRKTATAVEICEKPQEGRAGMKAWGLLSFQPEAGRVLLQAQLASAFHHQWISLEQSFEFFDLESFKDLTR